MLSVIVAVYNVEKYIEKCIQSIVNQSIQELEIILIDDGSTDNSGAICDRYAKSDSRIRVIHKKNGGLSDARNAGIEVAQGEYIAFVDGDDYLHSKMYEVLMMNLKQTNADISICAFQDVQDYEIVQECDINSQLCEQIMPADVYHLFTQLIMTVAWNKVYKKDLFQNIRYPKGRLHEDEFVIHHLVGQSKKIVKTDLPLYYYVSRNGSIMKQINTKRIDDTVEAFLDRINYFEQNKLPNLVKETSDILGNALIMYGYRARKMQANNKSEIYQKSKELIRFMLNNNHVFFSDMRKRELKLYLFSPELCFSKRFIDEWGYRGIDKIRRICKCKG